MGFKMGLSQTLSGVDVKLGIRRYKNRLRLFENRVLERILDLRGVKYIRMEKINKTMRSSIICTLHKILREMKSIQ
jgi:hypothetical protein